MNEAGRLYFNPEASCTMCQEFAISWKFSRGMARSCPIRHSWYNRLLLKCEAVDVHVGQSVH